MTRLWGDGPPLWAVYGLGERGPRLTFCAPDGSAGQGDLAHFTAAALALALAQFLAAVPAGGLERAGAIVMDELRKAGEPPRHPQGRLALPRTGPVLRPPTGSTSDPCTRNPCARKLCS